MDPVSKRPRGPSSRHICDAAVAHMNKHSYERLCWGDGALVDIACAGGMLHGHPLDKMDRVFRAMERDDRFTKLYMRGHDSRGRPRRVRMFELRSEFYTGQRYT